MCFLEPVKNDIFFQPYENNEATVVRQLFNHNCHIVQSIITTIKEKKNVIEEKHCLRLKQHKRVDMNSVIFQLVIVKRIIAI